MKRDYKIEVLDSTICAAAQIINLKDVKEVTKHVMLEVHKDEVFIIATDGCCMIVKREGCQIDDLFDGSVNLFLPAELLKFVKNKTRFVTVKFSVDGEVVSDVSVNYDGMEVIVGDKSHLKPILWQKIVTRIQPSGEAAQFDTDYLVKLRKARKCLTGKDGALQVYHNGNNSAYVNMGIADTIGMLMPVMLTEEFNLPTWVTKVKCL